MKFSTKRSYDGRDSKARYVADKYQSILKGRVLDVGADRCHLRELLPAIADYTGIGFGDVDMEVNLETSPIPFPDNSFDCVLCLDVLEHLDSIHAVFDELTRVSKKYVIISLPNPYRDFIGMLFNQGDPSISFKYYGLPLERPDDRHKWFFSNSDAEKFIRARAAIKNMEIVQIDSEGAGGAKTIPSAMKRLALRLAAFGLSVRATDLYHKTLWAVLEKPDDKNTL